MCFPADSAAQDLLPRERPCGSCPYRRDVPSGVWDASEYDKLVAYDRPTGEQPPAMFLCHQQDGRLCAGWAGCHDMTENLALRLAGLQGRLTPEQYEHLLDYRTPVALWDSGAQAAAHGRREIDQPGAPARRVIDKLGAKLSERSAP